MKRPHFLKQINKLFEIHPVVAILGPRQVGKTTLAEMYAETQEQVHRYDLEDPRDRQRLENPITLLEKQEGLIIIDEIQRMENLFPVIRVLADQKKVNRKFLILGSASIELIRQSAETLAGRLAYMELPGFSSLESADTQNLWVYGGFPKTFLAQSRENSWTWIRHYVRNFIERDIPALGINISAEKMRQLWHMLAHYNCKTINYSDLSRSLELTSTTIKHYVNILEGTMMLQKLTPWHENISKQQVKAPKLLFKDTGILHYMLGISDWDSLLKNPNLGFSWESFALRQIILQNDYDKNDCYFWSTHQGAELDLLVMNNGKRIGYEFKFSEEPKITKSMRIAMKDLRLDSLTIVNPGPHEYELEENIRVFGLKI